MYRDRVLSFAGAYRPLHQVIPAGDLGGEGAAAVPHVVPVSLGTEQQAEPYCKAAPSSASSCSLGTQLCRLSVIQEKGTDWGCTSTT